MSLTSYSVLKQYSTLSESLLYLVYPSCYAPLGMLHVRSRWQMIFAKALPVGHPTDL